MGNDRGCKERLNQWFVPLSNAVFPRRLCVLHSISDEKIDAVCTLMGISLSTDPFVFC